MKLKTIHKDKNVVLKTSKHPPVWYLWVRPAANLFPVTTKGKVFVMHEYKPGPKRWIWGFPGGMIERGESAAQAAKRECEEELGLRASRVQQIVQVKTDFPDTSVTYFLGFSLKKTKGKGWEKIGKVLEVSPDRLFKLALDGKISDPRMVVAVLKLQRDLKAGKLKLR